MSFARLDVLLVMCAASLALIVIPVLFAQPRLAVILGVVGIVITGASGQVLRGMGETRENGAKLKARSYYMGAAAYVATALVALLNGVPRLLGA